MSDGDFDLLYAQKESTPVVPWLAFISFDFLLPKEVYVFWGQWIHVM